MKNKKEVKLQNIQGIDKKINTGLNCFEECYSRVCFKGILLLSGLVQCEECDQEVKLRSLNEYTRNKTGLDVGLACEECDSRSSF